MRKIPRTAKLDEAVGRVLFCCPRNFSNPIISKLDKHVVLLLINYTVTKISLQIILLRGAALTTDHSLKIFNHVFVLSFNGFLFTFFLFCSLSSSSWSTGKLPLWLFWLLSLKFWEIFVNFWENSGVFWKFTPQRERCECRYSADADACFAMIG